MAVTTSVEWGCIFLADRIRARGTGDHSSGSSTTQLSGIVLPQGKVKIEPMRLLLWGSLPPPSAQSNLVGSNGTCQQQLMRHLKGLRQVAHSRWTGRKVIRVALARKTSASHTYACVR